MAWTAPMTAVANTALAAADWNTYVRDNLLEMAVEATNHEFPGRIPIRTQSGGGRSMRNSGMTFDAIATEEDTTSSTYTDLATVGPVATGFSYTGWILVIAYCNTVTTVTGTGASVEGSGMSYEVDGAVTSIAADDNWATITSQPVASAAQNIQNRAMTARLQAVTAQELVTVTCKYRNEPSGQGWFSDRFLLVISF